MLGGLHRINSAEVVYLYVSVKGDWAGEMEGGYVTHRASRCRDDSNVLPHEASISYERIIIEYQILAV